MDGKRKDNPDPKRLPKKESLPTTTDHNVPMIWKY